MSDEKGYLFPDPPDPPGMLCVRVYIPDHQLYVAAFWGAYEFFTTWLAWMRDPLKRGRVAAAAWRRAFDKARAEFEATKGECFDMITGLRPNPLNECILQAQIDGVWTNVFDASCCGDSGGGDCLPALRYAGGAIQKYNAETDSWDNIGPQSPVNEVPIQSPPWEPAGNGACLAATNFGSLLEDRKNVFANAVGDGLTYGDTILQVFNWLLLGGGGIGWVLSQVGEGLSVVYQAMVSQYADVAAYDIEDIAVCLAVQWYEADGSMTMAGVNGLLGDIDAEIAEHDPISPEATAWRYAYSWVKAAGSDGMQLAGQFKGLTDPNCDDCPWSYLMDFSVNDGGFVTGNFAEDPAFYEAGYYVGDAWKTQVKAHSGSDVPVLAIERRVRPTVITKVIVEIEGFQDGMPLDTTDGISVNGFQIASGWATGPATITHAWEPGTSLDNLSIGARARNAGTGYPDAWVKIKSVKWFGTGANPFVSPLPPVGA